MGNLPIQNKGVFRDDKTKFVDFFHPQQKVGISQEFSGKGCL